MRLKAAADNVSRFVRVVLISQEGVAVCDDNEREKEALEPLEQLFDGVAVAVAIFE